MLFIPSFLMIKLNANFRKKKLFFLFKTELYIFIYIIGSKLK